MTEPANEQERFWLQTYANRYIERNNSFDNELGLKAWRRMLAKAERIDSLLECGSNIGRNIGFLEQILPEAEKSIIELAVEPYRTVTERYPLEQSFNGSIIESNFALGSFDLVFTTAVLIHIHPDEVIANMRKMFDYSRRYILIAEYFNRTPVMIEYQGEWDRLFKSDFGKTFVTNFDVQVLDYGFHWGHEFDNAGFDDITWWLFEKKDYGGLSR